jgi:hypothetical protein
MLTMVNVVHKTSEIDTLSYPVDYSLVDTVII